MLFAIVMRSTCVVVVMAMRTSTALAEEPEPTLAPDGDPQLQSTAKDPRTGDEDSDGTRYLLVAGETALVIGLGAAWYWNDIELQRPDWVLGWDTESWDTKLTSFDAVRFDSNAFHINAFGHAGQAVLHYHVGRGNGLGLAGATALNVATTVAWEYLVEFREYVSLNDLIVNSMAGPALGEPLWQIGDYFRSGPKTGFNEAFAAFFQPIDEIEHRVNGRKWRESARPWHRFRIAGGTTTTDAETTALVDIDLEVASFDRSGARSGWTPAGGWSRLAGGVRFTDGVAGGHLYSRTSYGGYQSRAVVEDGVGRTAFVGFGTGVTFESNDLGMETDQLAAYHLLGPQFDLHLRTKELDVRFQSAAYGDLGLVHAYALGTMPPIDPEPPFESPLTGHGYYYGLGATAWTRLLVEWRGWHADVEAHAHQLFSIDGRNNGRGEPEPPKDLEDGRIYGQVQLGYSVIPRRLSIDGVIDYEARRGTALGMTRESDLQRYGVLLSLQH